jgi:TetR/AcrR family transcriptional regulator, fatty acid metabolism regulator protein
MASLPQPTQPAPEAHPAQPLSLKERQRKEREQLILQAAMDLLIEKGYHETSMEEIASRVGISKGAVYLHFSSKEDLIAALFDRGIQSCIVMLDEQLSHGGTPGEKVSQIIEMLYGNMSRRFRLMAAVAQSPELHRLLAANHETMASRWEEPSRRIAAIIDEGKRSGEFDPLLPTPLVLSQLWGLLSPRGYQQLIIRDGMALDEVVSYLCRYFLKGIAADKPPIAPGEDR